MTTKILAIGAHPDDVEFGCGGILIKEIQKGSLVKIIVCSLGEAGTNGTPESRKQEAINAAKIIGAEIEFLDMGGDCHIQPNPENILKLTKIIREFKPEIVLTTELERNQHPDHFAVSQITQSACRYARYGGLSEVKDLPIHKVQNLYFYPSRAEWGNKPNIFIDVTNSIELWKNSMQAHESQMKTKAYLNLILNKTAAWGASIGVAYAVGLWTNDPVNLNHLSDLNLSSRNY